PSSATATRPRANLPLRRSSRRTARTPPAVTGSPGLRTVTAGTSTSSHTLPSSTTATRVTRRFTKLVRSAGGSRTGVWAAVSAGARGGIGRTGGAGRAARGGGPGETGRGGGRAGPGGPGWAPAPRGPRPDDEPERQRERQPARYDVGEEAHPPSSAYSNSSRQRRSIPMLPSVDDETSLMLSYEP